MIFRTGNILILGHSSIDIFYEIYDFLKCILEKEFNYIHDHYVNNIPEKKKKILRKKTILVSKD